MDESEHTIVLRRQAGRWLQKMMYLFIFTPLCFFAQIAVIVAGINYFKKGIYVQSGAGVFAVLLLMCTYYFALSAINEERKVCFHVELTDTAIMGYLHKKTADRYGV